MNRVLCVLSVRDAGRIFLRKKVIAQMGTLLGMCAQRAKSLNASRDAIFRPLFARLGNCRDPQWKVNSLHPDIFVSVPFPPEHHSHYIIVISSDRTTRVPNVVKIGFKMTILGI